MMVDIIRESVQNGEKVEFEMDSKSAASTKLSRSFDGAVYSASVRRSTPTTKRESSYIGSSYAIVKELVDENVDGGYSHVLELYAEKVNSPTMRNILDKIDRAGVLSKAERDLLQKAVNAFVCEQHEVEAEREA